MVGVHVSQLTVDEHEHLVFATLLLFANVSGNDPFGFLPQPWITVHLREKRLPSPYNFNMKVQEDELGTKKNYLQESAGDNLPNFFDYQLNQFQTRTL